MEKTVQVQLENESPVSIAWLADAPLFIDERRVGAFYDAVIMPERQEGSITVSLSKETAKKLTGKVGIGAEFSISSWLKSLIPGFDAKVTASAGAEAGAEKKDGSSESVQFFPITTPQRQLVQLAIHYAANLPDRFCLLESGALPSTDWRSSAFISKVPRALVFIDLPAASQDPSGQIIGSQIVPTAAEFANGEIVLIYRLLRSKDGKTEPPDYPEPREGVTNEQLKAQRKDYWNWFRVNYSATRSMVAVEEASNGRGRLRWIDFRVPITSEGDTLHIHACPSEQYDTGVFAYNFIKRGFKHGLRLVGTLKSEPDLNLLAVFEK